MASAPPLPFSALGIAPESRDAAALDYLVGKYEKLFDYLVRASARSRIRRNAAAGNFNGGVIPLGYRIAGGKYEIEEDEARIVRLILSLYGAGASFGEIASACSEKDYRSRRGRAFSRCTIRVIVRRFEQYHGTYLYGRLEGRKEKSTLATRIEGAIPAIIDDATYEKVKARHERQAARNKEAAARRKSV